MEKILVTGANGLLGQHLAHLLLQEGYAVTGIGRGPCRLPFDTHPHFSYYEADVTDEEALRHVYDAEKPAVTVHAAAITQIDECELDHNRCEFVNVQGTATVLLYAESCCRQFIFISSDFVFDGVDGNYKEDDHLNPVSWYGHTKVHAESIVETSEIPWTTVRTCLVYGNAPGGTRNNIITWVKQSLEQGTPIKVVSDQWRTPTYVEDLAKGILLVIRKQATGIYHISGKDTLTPYDMALETAALFGLNDALIEKVNATVFSQPARRPPKTGFDISRARKELGFEPLGFKEGLGRMFNK